MTLSHFKSSASCVASSAATRTWKLMVTVSPAYTSPVQCTAPFR